MERPVAKRKRQNNNAFDSRRNHPPDDDVCPICFGNFRAPCKANCGHWFCGNCILELWRYGPADKQCKFPMCSILIIKLSPEASLLRLRDADVVLLLKNIQGYNSLYVGAFKSFLRRIPFFIRRMFQHLGDPFVHLSINLTWDFIVVFLKYVDLFGYIPTEVMEVILGVVRFFNFWRSVIYLVLMFHLAYRLYPGRNFAARQREHHARQPSFTLKNKILNILRNLITSFFL